MDMMTKARLNREIVYRTKGNSHGALTRLMSPSDLGQVLKPFVFLDFYDDKDVALPTFGYHPHSGLATFSYIAEGSWRYEDSNGASGTIVEGGTEWMQAGAAVWHTGQPITPHTRGFQLWLALPPHLELAPSQSAYQGPDEIPAVGPAKVMLGSYQGAASAIVPPSPLTYLSVSLKAGEEWSYTPPEEHTVLWGAVSKGRLSVPEGLEAGELFVFAPGEDRAQFVAEVDSEFVIGSAVPHEHDLVLGYYSVHTNDEALRRGEANIEALGTHLRRQGRI
jgi:redox-sensitive bicupin YhaK (pirin superfamily)